MNAYPATLRCRAVEPNADPRRQTRGHSDVPAGLSPRTPSPTLTTPLAATPGRRPPRLAAFGALAVPLLALLLLGVSSARAADLHTYLPERSAAVSLGVPAGAETTNHEPAVTGPVGGESYYSMSVAPGEGSGQAGRLWVAGPERVDEFNADTGQWLQQLPLAELPKLAHEEAGYGFNEEYGVAVGASTGEREVYVTDGSRLAVFGPDGLLQATWTGADTPQKSFADPATGFTLSALALDESASLADWARGDVVVAAGGRPSAQVSLVDVFAPQAGGGEHYVTQLLGTCRVEGVVVGEPGCEASEVVPFTHVHAIAVDPATGDLWVGDETHIDVFEPTGLDSYRYLMRLDGPPSHDFTVPVWSIAAGGGPDDGDVYVSEESGRAGASHVVYQFSSAGAFVGSIAGTPTGPAGSEIGFPNINGVAVDPAQPSADDPTAGAVFIGAGEAGGGRVDGFGPDVVIPDAITASPGTVTAHTAVLAGEVDPLGEGAAECWFAWGTSEQLGSEASCDPREVPSGSTAEPVTSLTLEGLSPDTNYYYRLEASNAHGVNTALGFAASCPGHQVPVGCSFTTAGPKVDDESVSAVTSTSASLNARINPHNGPSSLSHGARVSAYFQYSTSDTEACTTSSCSTVPAAPGTSLGQTEATVGFSETVPDLAAGTLYHYRTVVESEPPGGPAELVYGPDRTFRTQIPGPFGLIDGREWEMVSPPAKEGARISAHTEHFGVIQAAAGGSRIAYLANVPTEKGVAGYASEAQVLSVSSPTGWSSHDLAAPHNRSVGVSITSGEEYRWFNEDLSEGVIQPFGKFEPCRSSIGEPQACISPFASEQTAFLSDLTTGEYTPIATGCPPEGDACEPQIEEHADVLPGTVFGQRGDQEPEPCPTEKLCGPFFDGATPDGSHVVVRAWTQLTNEPAPDGGLYEYSTSAPFHERLQLISVLPDGDPDAAAWLGNKGPSGNGAGREARNAISADGTRVFWTGEDTTGVEPQHLYVTDTVSHRPALHIGGSGLTLFQDANSDGSRVFYTEGGSLYVCELADGEGALECVTTRLGVAPAGHGKVIGASEDGSYVYWVTATRTLTEAHRAGDEWHETPIAVLSQDDETDWSVKQGESLQVNARVSPNGAWLAFQSDRELAGYDTHDARTGRPDEEVYVFDAATGDVSCASCDPSAALPLGEGRENFYTPVAGEIPGWVENELEITRYQPRYLSDDGRLFFNSDDALVPQDIDGTWDVYEYEPAGIGNCSSSSSSGSVVFKPGGEVAPGVVEGEGCVGLISSGRSPQESLFLDASETGEDVFFVTTAKLAPQDFDDADDVYDAHECSASSPCTPAAASEPPPCQTAESCRAAPGPPPAVYSPPSSSTFNGAGNQAPASALADPAKSPVKKQAARKCTKGKKLRRGRCVKAAARKAKKSRKLNRAGKGSRKP